MKYRCPLPAIMFSNLENVLGKKIQNKDCAMGKSTIDMLGRQQLLIYR